MTADKAEAVARAARERSGATHALAVLIELDDGADRIDFGGTIWLGDRDGGSGGVPPVPHAGRPRLGAAGRGGAGAGLPAAPPAGPAGGGTNRFREDMKARGP